MINTPGKRVALFPIPWGSSYWKENLLVGLNKWSQTLLLFNIFIDFNGLSIRSGIFYTYIFMLLFLEVFVAHSSIEYEEFLNRSIRPIEGTLTNTIIVRQEVMTINGHFTLFRSP